MTINHIETEQEACDERLGRWDAMTSEQKEAWGTFEAYCQQLEEEYLREYDRYIDNLFIDNLFANNTGVITQEPPF